MMLMAFPVGITATVAALLSTAVAAVLLVGRRKPQDPVDALTERVREQSRHPVRYALTHPVDTVRRRLRSDA